MDRIRAAGQDGPPAARATEVRGGAGKMPAGDRARRPGWAADASRMLGGTTPL